MPGRARDPARRANEIALEAPAKINRELRIGARRPDGYHEVRSRLVAVDLTDGLEAEDAPDFLFCCSDRGVPSDGRNLAARAAQALAARLGRAPACRLELHKRIPVGAGLGGGSSDAAAVLTLLAALWEIRLEEPDRLALAETLGSDVPFFLVGGEAEVTGRGEVVTPRPDEAPRELLLLVPPFSISTAAVYAAHKPGPRLPSRLEIEDSDRFLGTNDLEPAVLAVRPEMKTYLLSARQAAPDAGVTGSGSAVVLAGAEPDAQAWLAKRHPEVTLLRCRTLSRQDYRTRVSPHSGGTPWTSRR